MDDFDYEYLDEDDYEDYDDFDADYDEPMPVPEPWEDIEEPYYEPIKHDDWSKSFKHNKKDNHIKDYWRDEEHDNFNRSKVVELIALIVYCCCVCTCTVGLCSGFLYTAYKMKKTYS